MKKYFLILFVMAFSFFSMLGCNRNVKVNNDNSKHETALNVKSVSKTNTSVNNNSSSDITKAPNFTLIDTKGKKISLSSYKGKVVILDFWATWCPPCRRGIPDLIDIQKKFKNKVAVIGVSLDTDTKSNVVPFMKNFGINYPIVYANQKVVEDYGNIQAIPTTFVIDKKGNIVDQYVGLTPKENFIEDIQRLL